MVIEFEADSQYGIRHLVFLLSDLEQALAKVTAKIERWPDLRRVTLISSIVELLAQLPAGFPGLTLTVSLPGMTERPLTVYLAETSQCVAQRPAFAERQPQCCHFIVHVLKLANGFVEAILTILPRCLVIRLFSILGFGDIWWHQPICIAYEFDE